MPHDNFQSSEDAFTLVRAKEIEEDSGRVNRARSFLQSEGDKFKEMASMLPTANLKTVNNGVRDSKMEPK